MPTPLNILHERLNGKSLELTQHLVEEQPQGLWAWFKQCFSGLLESIGLYSGMRKVLHFQAALEVIAQHEKDLPAEQKTNLNQLSYDQAKEKLGSIPNWRDKFKGIFSSMCRGTFNSASPGVPQSGALAVKLKEASPQQIDIMLVVQGLERTRRILKNEEEKSADALLKSPTKPEEWLKECISGKSGRQYIGQKDTDSAEMVGAQTLNHTALILKQAANSLPAQPIELESKEEKNAIWSENVQDAIALLTATYYEKAAKTVASRDFAAPQARRIRLAEDFKALAKELKPNKDLSLEQAKATVQNALETVKNTMNKYFPEEQRQEITSVLDKRSQAIGAITEPEQQQARAGR